MSGDADTFDHLRDVASGLPYWPTVVVSAVVLTVLILLLAFIIRGAWFVPARPGDGGWRGPYRPREFMTGNEIEFFGRLCRALPDFHIFPQVAMSALIEPTMSKSDESWWNVFGKISQKRVDYCVYEHKTMRLLAIVELDDRTHNPDADALRDSYTGCAGITTLRFESRQKPSVGDIRAAILRLAA